MMMMMMMRLELKRFLMLWLSVMAITLYLVLLKFMALINGLGSKCTANYRIPKPFRDQVVICIGSSASAADISRDIAGVAKEVHIASRSALDGTTKRHPSYDNIWLHSMVKLLGYSPMIERVHEDDSVAFQDVSVIFADAILHCTGYKYHFPFLDTNGLVTVDDNRVGPLYKHIFPPALAPGLSFVGLPWKVVPFAML